MRTRPLVRLRGYRSDRVSLCSSVGFKAYCGLVAVEDGRLKALYTDFDKDGLARPLPRPQQCTGLALAAQFVMSAMSQFKLRPRVTCEATCRVQSAAWQRR